jgi:hypothetical protein
MPRYTRSALFIRTPQNHQQRDALVEPKSLPLSLELRAFPPDSTSAEQSADESGQPRRKPWMAAGTPCARRAVTSETLLLTFDGAPRVDR